MFISTTSTRYLCDKEESIVTLPHKMATKQKVAGTRLSVLKEECRKLHDQVICVEEKLQRLSVEGIGLVGQAESIHDSITEESNKLHELELRGTLAFSKVCPLENSITHLVAQLKLATDQIREHRMKYEETEKELGRLHRELKEKQQEELLQQRHFQEELQRDLVKANLLTKEAREGLGTTAGKTTLFTLSIEQLEEQHYFLQVPIGNNNQLSYHILLES